MSSPRTMPNKESISEYWNIDLESCWRCNLWQGGLERAHIVDRLYWNEYAHLLDIEENLWMLCKPCHSIQPSFDVDEYVNALAWMNLDAIVYSEVYWSNTDMASVQRSEPEMFKIASNVVANMLQDLWNQGFTNRGFSTLL